jgi:site-specific recombinase XerD
MASSCGSGSRRPTRPGWFACGDVPRNRGARERVATGIYRDARGFSIVAVVGGEHHERRYPLGTGIRTLMDRREDLKAELRREQARTAATSPQFGTLKADAPRYLAAVHSMPSYAARAWQIGLWVEALGHRQRDAINPADVSTQLHTWHAAGDAPQTCNHLRTALVQLYVRLDGKEARNPARAVPKFRVEAPVARALPVLAVARILRQFRPRSQTRARLAVIATTGISHAEMMRLMPDDIRPHVLIARARRKGHGTQPRTIPLTKHARLALRAFVRSACWGRFSTASMRSRFLDACERAGYSGRGWRPYDLRHTFATAVALASGDDRAVQELLGHTDRKTGQRYTLGSVDARVAKAIEALDGANRRGQLR